MSTNRDNLDPRQLDALEGRLAGTLKPVSPPRELVRRLRSHIHMPERGELVVRFHDWERLALVFGGVLSGTVMVLTVARALFHLFGRRNG